MLLRYQKLRPDAWSPETAYGMDLGLDLRTPEAVILAASSSHVIDTGLRIQIPEVPHALKPDFILGCFIWSKSGLSVKSNIEKGAGVIDPGYTGSLQIKLYNHGHQDVSFECGDKIAQMVFMLCAHIDQVQESNLDDWQTDRGEKGFGSSGR